MDKYAIIVAGGIGSRMNSEIPKQYLELNGKPVFIHSIQIFLDAYVDTQVILVVSQLFLQKAKDLLLQYISNESQERITITTGGETRFHSVQNGLEFIKNDSIVWVHDAVRCLISIDLVTKCYNNALKFGCAIPAVSATDSIRITDNFGNHTIDRDTVKIIQTPQTFKSDLLLKAFETGYSPTFTDEASVVEYVGEKIHLIEGEYTNIKITRPIDLIIAENILK